MNEQYHKSLIKKLVSNARAIITEEIGVSIGCSKMNNILLWLEPFEKIISPNIDVFEKYNEVVQFIPSGSARLYCSEEAFKRYDSALQAENQRFREKIIQACFELIDKYGEKENRLNL